MKSHSVHNVSTKPLLLRHVKSGLKLKIQPGINHISADDFYVLGKQIRNHPSLKMLRELNDVPVADTAPVSEAAQPKKRNNKSVLNDTATPVVESVETPALVETKE